MSENVSKFMKNTHTPLHREIGHAEGCQSESIQHMLEKDVLDNTVNTVMDINIHGYIPLSSDALIYSFNRRGEKVFQWQDYIYQHAWDAKEHKNVSGHILYGIVLLIFAVISYTFLALAGVDDHVVVSLSIPMMLVVPALLLFHSARKIRNTERYPDYNTVVKSPEVCYLAYHALSFTNNKKLDLYDKYAPYVYAMFSSKEWISDGDNRKKSMKLLRDIVSLIDNATDADIAQQYNYYVDKDRLVSQIDSLRWLHDSLRGSDSIVEEKQ